MTPGLNMEALDRPVPDEARKLRQVAPSILALQLALPDAHRDLARAGLGPAELSARLRALSLTDAELAHFAVALPEREAVWWGCMCVRYTGADPLEGPDAQAVALAEAWVRTPTAACALACREAAKRPETRTAAVLLPRAVAVSRHPAPNGTRAARVIASAVRRLVEAAPEMRRAALRQEFAASAREIAAGGAGRIGARRRAEGLPE